MKNFKDLGIKSDLQSFTGDKIKMSKILNREVTVIDYKIEDSKYGPGGSKCLYMQIAIGEVKHVVFTGSKPLMDTILKIPKPDFPFKTTIVKENEWYEFT